MPGVAYFHFPKNLGLPSCYDYIRLPIPVTGFTYTHIFPKFFLFLKISISKHSFISACYTFQTSVSHKSVTEEEKHA